MSSGKSMYPFSFDLFGGAYFFAEAAITESEARRRRYYNAAAVVFAAASIEAVLNEQISLRSQFGPDSDMHHVPKEFYEALVRAQKSISLKDKWNLFLAVRGGWPWDPSAEPFQSYELLIALRNELLHYKAEFLPDGEPPLRKLQPLIDRLAVSDAPVEEDETPVWLKRILESQQLGAWLKQRMDYTEILRAVLQRKP